MARLLGLPQGHDAALLSVRFTRGTPRRGRTEAPHHRRRCHHATHTGTPAAWLYLLSEHGIRRRLSLPGTVPYHLMTYHLFYQRKIKVFFLFCFVFVFKCHISVIFVYLKESKRRRLASFRCIDSDSSSFVPWRSTEHNSSTTTTTTTNLAIVSVFVLGRSGWPSTYGFVFFPCPTLLIPNCCLIASCRPDSHVRPDDKPSPESIQPNSNQLVVGIWIFFSYPLHPQCPFFLSFIDSLLLFCCIVFVCVLFFLFILNFVPTAVGQQ